MFVFKIFPNVDKLIKFENNIISMTDSFENIPYRSSGLFSRIKNFFVTILDIEKDPSLRGANFNISFNGIIIPWISKKIIFGWIGPSLLYTILTVLIASFPHEYIEFRIIAILVWFIVYLTSIKRIKRLKELITQAFDC